MAYDASKETRTVLETIDKNSRGDKIQVTSIVVKGNSTPFIDIRNMYTLEDSDEVRPTSKGIRFSSEFLLDIMKSLVTSLTPDELDSLKDAINEVEAEEENE